ncbi:MAG TPA: futalosine hydrolase [Chitinophagaceae bacterium]|nr:futalosine hydrolase [Chitinophagaceae bacterium]
MGKNILVAAATAKEINPFIQSIRKGQLSKNSIDILISGIGLTASTYHFTKQLRLKKYDLVIQAGVAGSFNHKIPPGSVVAVRQDTIADQSVIELEKLKTLFDLKLVPRDQHPYKKGWLMNPNNETLKKTKLKTVKGISVNQISTSKQMIRFYRDVFDPVTESMEGAALHYVCVMEKVPFVQIRAISNYIGERNKKKWDMNESIAKLNVALTTLINNY